MCCLLLPIVGLPWPAALRQRSRCSGATPTPKPSMPTCPAVLPPACLSLQRALLRTAQEIAKGMGYIHEFNIGALRWV